MEDDDYFESAIEYDEALKRGEEPSFSAYAARHAEHPDRKDYLRHLIKMHSDHLRYRCQSPIPSITHLCANNDGLVRELEGQLRDELEPEFLCPERVDEYAIESVEYQGPGSFVLLGDSPRVGKVAIKFAREVEDTEQWIRNEKNCLQRLSHPCIVKFDGFGSYRGRPYIATKHFEGKTLAVVSGSLEKSRVVAIIKDVARAVQYLHDRQIVHYDLGPQNIVLIEGSETPLIFDFGLSVHIDAHSNPNGYARGAHGTPGFMSPEQAAGDPNADAVRCDIFQLGALLVFGLKRQRIFIGDTDGSIIENTLLRAFNTPVLRELQREDRMLARICKRAVAENPPDRYATARELADALEDYQYRRFGKPSNIAKDWRVWAALVSAGVVVALLPKHPSNSNAKSMHAIASAPDGAMPAELADQLAAQGIDLTAVSTEDLTVGIELYAPPPGHGDASKFGLRNELKPRFSIDFLPEFDLPLYLSYRMYPRPWQPVLTDLDPTVIPAVGDNYGIIEPNDFTATGPFQVKIETGRESGEYYQIGPFNFEINLQDAIELAYQKAEQEFLRQARDVRVLEFRRSTVYEHHDFGKWELTKQVRGIHRLAIDEILIGTAPEALNRRVSFTTFPSSDQGYLSQVDGYYNYPEAIDQQFLTCMRGLETVALLYAQVRFVDNSLSPVVSYNRLEEQETPGDLVKKSREIIERLEAEQPVGRIVEVSSYHQGIELYVGRAARAIASIRYGENRDELNMDARVQQQEVTSPEALEHARYRATVQPCSEMGSWNVVDDYSQNFLPVPTSFENTFIQWQYVDGRYSKIYTINNEDPSPGVMLRTTRDQVPMVCLNYRDGKFQLFWHSEDRQVWEVAFQEKDMESVHPPFSNLKQFDPKWLGNSIQLEFKVQNTGEPLTVDYELSDAELRSFLVDVGLKNKGFENQVVSAIRAEHFDELDSESSDNSRRRRTISANLMAVAERYTERPKTIQMLVGSGSYFAGEGAYRLSGLKAIAVGPTEDNQPDLAEVELPLSTLIHGTDEYGKPLFLIETPVEYAKLFVRYIYADGTTSDAFPLAVEEYDCRR